MFSNISILIACVTSHFTFGGCISLYRLLLVNITISSYIFMIGNIEDEKKGTYIKDNKRTNKRK